MTGNGLRAIACARAMALGAPALAQNGDVAARLSAMEAQMRAQAAQIARQQALIDEQAAAIAALRDQTAVPDELSGQPVTATDVILAPPGNASAAATSPSESGTDTGAGIAGSNSVAVVALTDPSPLTGTDTLGEGVRRALEASRLLALSDLERPRVAMVAGRPTIASADGRYSLSMRGVVQVDAGLFDQRRQRSPALDFRRGSVGAGGRETNAAADLSNGANFRRARIGFEGVLDRDFGYRLMFEFGGTGTEGPARINDAWLSYTGFAPFTFQIGAFSPPANMDDGQSPEDQIFLERASAAELSRTLAGADGRFGVGFRVSDRRYFGALTATGPTVNDAETFDEQFGVVGRGGILVATEPLDNTYNVQVGANGTYVVNTPDAGATAVPRSPARFRDRPELRLDGARLVDTGPIDADNVAAYGVEFGAQYRNLFVQAEHFWFDVDRRASAFANPSFKGGYAEASWILTGEYRRHNIATGSFQNPRPYRAFSPANGGFGAFELAARYSYLDLDFRPGAAGAPAIPGSVRGGEQRIVTLGLNWYLNSNAKLLFNYLHVDVDRLNPAGPGNLALFGPGTATPPLGVDIGQAYDAFAVRTQFSF